jgi:hypothetical protein
VHWMNEWLVFETTFMHRKGHTMWRRRWIVFSAKIVHSKNT